MKGNEQVLKVLEEIRDNQLKQQADVEKILHDFDASTEAIEVKYEEHLKRSRAAYNNHLKKVFVIAIGAIAFIIFMGI